MRCIIVDDEKQSRAAMKEALKEQYIDVDIISEVNSVTSAVEAIDSIKPDLVFLDIELGDGSGFDVVEQTKWNGFKVIFTTAYSEYAVEAFRINAIDYLLKPVNKSLLTEALHRVTEKDEKVHNQQIKTLMHQLNQAQASPKISIPTIEGQTIVEVKDIIRCESDNNYSKIFYVGGEQLYVAKTLKELEMQLSQYEFQRAHQSHLINMEHLKKYLNRDGGCLQMSDNSIIPVAQRKKSYILSLLENYKL